MFASCPASEQVAERPEVQVQVLRIEADNITLATGSDLEIWSAEPVPLGATLDAKTLRKPQGPRSGISAIFGKWPGDETDEEFEALLKDHL